MMKESRLHQAIRSDGNEWKNEGMDFGEMNTTTCPLVVKYSGREKRSSTQNLRSIEEEDSA